MNKRKIVNDPVYGLIHVPYDIIYEVIEHRYFQRLRRIKQLGLTHLIYPGATHTRFEHVLGAMHLMTLAIEVLRGKGIAITDNEAKGLCLAILLHDIGHGPFSHTMEGKFIPSVSHEKLTLLFMKEMNLEFNGELDTCIQIFTNKHKKKFLHQLVSSQLDMDRLDYLGRDSFYSGVSEGVIGAERIIKMLTLHNNHLAVEAKGIYSIENFLIARRLMYWQVYLHKTCISAENLLHAIFKRVAFLSKTDKNLFCTPSLRYFIYNEFAYIDVIRDEMDSASRKEILEQFSELDDTDIISAIKVWMHHNDLVLSKLAKALINRELFSVEIHQDTIEDKHIKDKTKLVAQLYKISTDEAEYFVQSGFVSNHAYSIKSDKINIINKEGSSQDVSLASDMLNISVLSKKVKKYFLCYPKEFKR